MTEITWMDAGGEIDLGAMVTSEILYLDYKAAVPQHFDKVVVKEVIPFNHVMMEKVMGEVMPSLIKNNDIVLVSTPGHKYNEN